MRLIRNGCVRPIGDAGKRRKDEELHADKWPPGRLAWYTPAMGRTVLRLGLMALGCLLWATAAPAAAKEPTIEQRVAEIAKDLRNPDWEVQRRAAEDLGELGPAALPAITELMQDVELEPYKSGSGPTLESVGCAIGAAGSSDPSALAEYLAADDARVRIGVAVGFAALARQGLDLEPQLPQLIDALADADPRVRAIIANHVLMYYAGRPAVQAALVGKLGDTEIAWLPTAENEHQSVGYWAMSSLMDHTAEARPLLATALSSDQPQARVYATRMLSWLGSDAAELMPEFRRLSTDENADVRGEALSTMAYIAPADPAVRDALTAALSDDDQRVRAKAADALDKMVCDLEPALPGLLEVARRREGWGSQTALRTMALNLPGNAAVIDALFDALDFEDRNTYLFVAGWLANIGEPVLDRLIDTLNSPSAAKRYAAAYALARMGADAVPALDGLLALTTDESAKVRAQACLALGALGEAAAPAVPALITALDDKDDSARQAAAGALAGLGPAAQAAVPALMRVVDENGEDRWTGNSMAHALVAIAPDSPAVLALLRRLYRRPDAYERCDAVRALAELAKTTTAAFADLVLALRDADSNVRYQAAKALARLHPADTAVATALLPLLDDEDAWVRQAACQALGAIGPVTPDVEPALTVALSDPDEDVGNNAAAALLWIHGIQPREFNTSTMWFWSNLQDGTELESNF